MDCWSRRWSLDFGDAHFSLTLSLVGTWGTRVPKVPYPCDTRYWGTSGLWSYHPSMNVAPALGSHRHDSSTNSQWAISSSNQWPLSSPATRTTALSKMTRLSLTFWSVSQMANGGTLDNFHIDAGKKTSLCGQYWRERLLYDYGVHAGQPPISQSFHLDLKHVTMCSWWGVVGIIDNPCLLPDLSNYSGSILCFVRFNINRRADNAWIHQSYYPWQKLSTVLMM